MSFVDLNLNAFASELASRIGKGALLSSHFGLKLRGYKYREPVHLRATAVTRQDSNGAGLALPVYAEELH